MRKQRILGVVILTVLTAAVLGAYRFLLPERETVLPAEEHMRTASPAVTVLEVSVEEVPEDDLSTRNMLPDLDISALSAAMPKEDYTAFETYLPVLQGQQTFRWVEADKSYSDYYPNWESFDADMTAVRDQFWDGFGGERPATLTLDRLAVQDIDRDGTAELVLLFQDGAYNYLILHREGDTVYGTVLYVRWFMELQQNGVYVGSGGAGDSTFYRMTFQNGRFEEQNLGRRIDDAYICYRELDGREVTKEAFDAWYAENMVGGVTWYAPDGTVFQDTM